MNKFYEGPYKQTVKLFEKRFSIIRDFTDELFELMEKMTFGYFDPDQMQLNTMYFNDKVEELKEEYALVLAICSVYDRVKYME